MPQYQSLDSRERGKLRLRLVIAVLEKRLADALGNSAMRLTVQDQRVDRAPDIAPQPLGKPARGLLRLGTGNVEVG
jgi:hypothetical protein